VQRPNKLRVITSGDGKASEYYYDGKTLTAFAPSENLVAVAPRRHHRCLLEGPSRMPQSTSHLPTSWAPIPSRIWQPA
jgi:hypothetical protein